LDPANTGHTFLDGKRFFTDENLCRTFTNLDDSDIHKLIPLTNFGKGYWGGTNNVGITEITECFSVNHYERITAVSLGIGKVDDAIDGKDSEITLKIYNGTESPEELIHSQVLKIKNLVENAMNRIELEEIVQPADTFFVGFELSNIMPGDSFVVFQSLREPGKENNFYFKQEGEWQNFKNSNIDGYALSNVVELLACGFNEIVTDSPLVKSTFEVLVYPNPTGSEITVETGEEDLTIEDIKVFNLTGQLVDVKINRLQEKKTTVNLKGNAPGIYFVRIETTKGFVLKKISFVPW
ncbi:MAG: T9SS type A sorting domain-containing protein, partial [Prolixibacteraceae bacterium]